MTSLGRGGPLDNHKYQFEPSCVETREVIRSVLFMTHNKKIMKEKVDSIYKHSGFMLVEHVHLYPCLKIKKPLRLLCIVG